MRAPRLAPPATLAHLLTDDPYERLLHTYGKSYPETVRAFDRDFANAPDLVAFPRDEADVAAVLDWASGAKVAVIPFGCGSSVVGGVEPAVGDGFAGAVSLDLRRLDRVLEVDETSRAARIQAGIRGPAIEAALKPHGLAIRHYPQSFEFSTLGGWIATRVGRALRHAPHPHRRLRRKPPHRHARQASWSRAACPARAPGRARTA